MTNVILFTVTTITHKRQHKWHTQKNCWLMVYWFVSHYISYYNHLINPSQMFISFLWMELNKKKDVYNPTLQKWHSIKSFFLDSKFIFLVFFLLCNFPTTHFFHPISLPNQHHKWKRKIYIKKNNNVFGEPFSHLCTTLDTIATHIYTSITQNKVSNFSKATTYQEIWQQLS